MTPGAHEKTDQREPAASDFLSGGGQMGERIRAFDWRSNPLGTPDQWPQSLRTVVRLMLTTNHPAFAFWGDTNICLYNDAHGASLGPEKNPAMLGQPARVAWDEIWPIIGPQIDSVRAGRGATWPENALIPITRNGRLKDVYWTFSYSPIDEEGAPNGVGGVLVLCTETTQQVLIERRQAFVVRLSDALRLITDPDTVMRVSAEELGEELDVDCCGFTRFEPDGLTAVVGNVWNRAGLPGVQGVHRAHDYGTGMQTALTSGEVVRIDDVDSCPLTAGGEGAFGNLRTRAILQVPMLDDGRLTASVWTLSATPRVWKNEEVDLIREVGRRTLAEAERARAESALRDSESLLRAIGESSAELIYAKDRDNRLLYANPATLAVIGKSADEVLGRTEREWAENPDEADAIMANDRRVIDGGKTERIIEHFTTPGGPQRIMQSTKAPMRNAAGEIIGLVGVTTDITERHRDQQHLRLLVHELNHRVKNTLAIVQSLAHQTFGSADEEALAAFERRLETLSAAHNLLTRERWEAPDLGAVIRETVGALDGGAARFEIDGPAVRIDPKAAVTIAMALHELCTNATKYGALSRPKGMVSIHWQVSDAIPPRLHLRWAERGGPTVRAPDTRGFGTRMIERALAAELHGTATLDYAPGGLVCAIDAPMPVPVDNPLIEP